MKTPAVLDAPITALAPWYGSKRTLASQIIPHLGEHSVYWEPFCGSCAVLFAKEPVKQETVNDLNGDLYNLARVVAHPSMSRDLDWRLRRTLVSEQIYHDAIKFLVANTLPGGIQSSMLQSVQVERAYHFFIRSWMGMNGVAGTRTRVNFAKRFTSNGGCPAVRFCAAVDSLPAWHERMRTVAIYNTCGIELCEKIEDKSGVVIYVDPPYVVKSDVYIHDFQSVHHSRLADALNRFTRTRVVVSYYAHPDLEHLYPPDRWQTVELTANRALKNASRAEKTAAPEILLINNPQEA